MSERKTASEALLLALENCRASGEVITVHSPFEERPSDLVNVPVVAIDIPARKFQVKRQGDDTGKWFAIRHIQGVTLSSGEMLESPEGKAYWEEIQGRREQKAEWRSELASSDHAPDVSKAPFGVRAQLIGAGVRASGRSGSQREVELWTVKSQRSELTRISVKDAVSAHRVCGLVEASYWDMAQAWLACEFEWTDWMQTNSQGNLMSAETITKVFRWGQATPGDLVSLYMAKSWEKHQIFKPSENHLTSIDAERLATIGLCVPAEQAPLETLFENALLRDIRSVLKEQGLKATDRDHGLIQLLQMATLDADAVLTALGSTTGFSGKWCLLPPCGLSWDTWQDFRTWHVTMIYAFSEYL